MSTVTIFWLAAAIGLLILEASTFNLVSIWFALGAIGGMAAARLGASFLMQLTVFALVGFAALLVTRPLVKRLRPRNSLPTAPEAAVGRTATVIAPIRAGQPGRVRLDGVDWRAVSAAELDEGQLCRVITVGATTLTVEPQPQYSTAN